jgi:hypothetical protein
MDEFTEEWAIRSGASLEEAGQNEKKINKRSRS